MKLLAAICAIIFSFSAIASAKARTHITDDFFIDTVSPKSKIFSQKAKPTDCKAHIRKVLCLVSTPTSADDRGKPRPCEAGGEAYAPVFETLYDNYPSLLQKMFCSLNVVYIEKNFEGTAYAGLDKDAQGNVLGAKMGIRQSVLDQNLNLQTWASWKEQLSFGGVADSYTPSNILPSIHTNTAKQVNDFLYFVVSHEFGHMFDFINNINAMDNCPSDGEEDVECNMSAKTWGSISWLTNKKPKPENEFQYREGLCFYWCQGYPLLPVLANTVYQSLWNSEFISIYATTQPWDDFADSLAYFLMNQNLQTSYVIDTNNGLTFDIMKKLKSPLWNEKYKYIENFLNRADIKYP